MCRFPAFTTELALEPFIGMGRQANSSFKYFCQRAKDSLLPAGQLPLIVSKHLSVNGHISMFVKTEESLSTLENFSGANLLIITISELLVLLCLIFRFKNNHIIVFY